MYESIIIGSSAAGISAAIYLKRRGINFLLIGKDIGGEMALSGEVENYPGIASTTGLELTKKFKEQAEKYGIEPKIAGVIALRKIENGFLIRGETIENLIFDAESDKSLSAFEETAKSIIIASGSRPKKLKVPGEEEYYRKGVSYCTLCDGPVMKSKPVAIIGGANSANESALMMAELCPKVYILTINNELWGDKILIDEISKKSNVIIITLAFTQEIFGDRFIKGLKYLDKKDNQVKEILVDGIFINIGMDPNTQFVPNEWKIKNELNEIITDKFGKTAISGVFAAGDATDIPYKQIAIAVGQGTTAALSAINYLNSKLK